MEQAAINRQIAFTSLLKPDLLCAEVVDIFLSVCGSFLYSFQLCIISHCPEKDALSHIQLQGSSFFRLQKVALSFDHR